MKLRQIEFRYGKINKAYELVRWYSDDHCFVIAFFERHSEGYDMRTVGERYFAAGPDAAIVASHALAFLNAHFDEEKPCES
jgi:hypothetical protein